MKIDTSTQLYGVIGNPVKHSKSPALFNSIFKKYYFNAVYLAFENANAQALLQTMKPLNIQGFSITIPHKEKSLESLDYIDPLAKELSCVNTVILQDDKLQGYNFDGQGAINALINQCKDWLTKRILIIGNGGAAKGIAITAAYQYHHQHIDILSRNQEKGNSISQQIINYSTTDKKYQSKTLLFSKITSNELQNYDIIINTTPLGMHPRLDFSPLSSEQLFSHQLVYDIIYNPLETKLLKLAKEKKCQTLNGLGMFLGQASLQLQLWTKLKLSLNEMSNHFDNDNQ